MDRNPSDKKVNEELRRAEIERKKAEERTGVDREVEKIQQTVTPGADAPPRSGITGSGSGADAERG